MTFQGDLGVRALPVVGGPKEVAIQIPLNTRDGSLWIGSFDQDICDESGKACGWASIGVVINRERQVEFEYFLEFRGESQAGFLTVSEAALKAGSVLGMQPRSILAKVDGKEYVANAMYSNFRLKEAENAGL